MGCKKVSDLTKNKTKVVEKLLSIMRGALSTKKKSSSCTDVFTLPGHSLPSQYRTLLPITDVEIERLLTGERKRRRIKNITLALVSVIIFFIVVIIALIIVLELSLNEKKGRLQLTAIHVNKTHFHVDEIKLLKAKAMVKPPRPSLETSIDNNPQQSGVRCISKCWDYAAFRFKSECVNGRCLCRDKNYDDITCLPKTKDCSIKLHRQHPSFQATFSGHTQTSYSCMRKSTILGDAPEIHVISTYGNKNIKSTAIRLKSSKKIKVILILASYEPIMWELSLDENLSLEDIVLISHYGVSRTRVNVTVNHKADPKIGGEKHNDLSPSSSRQISTLSPSVTTPSVSQSFRVTRMLIKTGYGDDRDSGNTPFLLGEITRRIGPVSSFFGVAQADNIVFDIGEGNYQLGSSHKKTTYKTMKSAYGYGT